MQYLIAIDKYEERIADGDKLTGSEMIAYYDAKEAAGIELTIEEKGNRMMLAYVEKMEALTANSTELTVSVLEKTGWDGLPLENNKNSNVIDQMSSKELKAVGLPDQYGACMFFSTIYGAADALGVTLTPEEVKKIYDTAKKNGAVSNTNDEGGYMPYWVNDFSDCVMAVAEVKKVDASNILIADKLVKTTPSANKEVANEIIRALDSGGSAQVRYSGHSMRVDGAFIENGVIILSIKDTASPNKKTYVDTSSMMLYTLKYNKSTKQYERVPSHKVITHYIPINKKE